MCIDRSLLVKRVLIYDGSPSVLLRGSSSRVLSPWLSGESWRDLAVSMVTSFITVGPPAPLTVLASVPLLTLRPPNPRYTHSGVGCLVMAGFSESVVHQVA